MRKDFKYLSQIEYMQYTSLGYVRVLHAVPDAPNVDIYANDKLIVENLAFGELTKYLPVPEGTYTISLYATGDKSKPVLQNTLTINKDKIMTIAAANTVNNITLIAIPDTTMKNETNKSVIRFMHLSPNAPAVDITLPDGTIIFSNISYEQLTQYVEVEPTNYNLQVRVAGTSNVVLTVPNVKLEPNRAYTIYAIGLVGSKPELQALLATDGISYNNY